MSAQSVLLAGEWATSAGTSTFQAANPATREALPDAYPVSPWDEIERAIRSAHEASKTMRGWPGERFAGFLEAYADGIEARTDDLVEMAAAETALPAEPRLRNVELPRTTNQLRLAAAAARDGSWTTPTIDSANNIRSLYGPIGPVAVFGPNNFPFAFNSIAGGDFAAAVAAGNPVIAKGHSSHPGTTRIFGEVALSAAQSAEMPAGFIQLIYRTSHEDGARFVSHPLMGATGYTGSRQAGLVLKEAADRAGKPIYLELSSINPVIVLPGVLQERFDDVVEQFCTSCLMGTGQFCTNPGLVVLVDNDKSREFVTAVADRFQNAPVGTMLGEGVERSFQEGVKAIQAAGATLVTGGEAGGGTGFSCQNTLLQVDGNTFLGNSEALQTEAFGNGSLMVIAQDAEQLVAIADGFEGNLTGCIYSANDGSDDSLYDQVAPALRSCVGRLLNDTMPTGVAVSPAMNHGGPFPATGHPAFTAVGIPASIHRFSMLQCYDKVRAHRLPAALQDKNPTGSVWRFIDGTWSQADVGS